MNKCRSIKKLYKNFCIKRAVKIMISNHRVCTVEHKGVSYTLELSCIEFEKEYHEFVKRCAEEFALD